jgi:hypothetical protein
MGRVCSRLKKEEKNTHTHTPVSMNVWKKESIWKTYAQMGE